MRRRQPRSSEGVACGAWLRLCLTHDLGALLDILRDREPGADEVCASLAPKPFAVQFRYEAISEGAEPLDRDSVAASLQGLRERVWKALRESGRD